MEKNTNYQMKTYALNNLITLKINMKPTKMILNLYKN